MHTTGRSRLVAYDFGAHVAEWSVDGRPRLWLSSEAVLDGSAPVRGGVPVCFPWFAAGPDGRHAPMHGLVRTAVWRATTPVAGEVWAWEITSDDVASAPSAGLVPGPFRLRYSVSLREDGEVLHLSLGITNSGDRTYRTEAALHTFLALDDVREVRMTGLEGAEYLDKLTGVRLVQDGPVRLTGKTDRVYDRSGPVIIEDRRARCEIRPAGATQTVVWNPWARVAPPEPGDDEWLRFVCVETVASGARSLTVEAGDTVEISCTLSHSAA